jgi:accessory gene regulator protein AgrB
LSKKLADSLALSLARHSAVPYSPAVLSYGLQILLNAAIKIALLSLVGWMLNILLELYLIVFFFGSLRMITGGVHAHTFKGCLTVSLISFVLLTVSLPFTFPFFIQHTQLVLLLMLAFGSALTFLYVPGKWGNRKFTNQRIRISKWLSLLYLLGVITAAWYASVYPDEAAARPFLRVCWLAMLGMTWQYILVTPFGYKLFRAERSNI